MALKNFDSALKITNGIRIDCNERFSSIRKHVQNFASIYSLLENEFSFVADPDRNVEQKKNI